MTGKYTKVPEYILEIRHTREAPTAEIIYIYFLQCIPLTKRYNHSGRIQDKMSETFEVTAPEFSEEVERQHVRVDADAWDRVYVIGDVHGCPEELERLLEKLSPTEDELLVFVGDLITKGPDSESVIERLRSTENAISVRGNNEQKLLEGRKELPGLGEDSLEYIRSMPVVVSWGNSLAVHGGVIPMKPLEAHTPTDLQETRSLYGKGYRGTIWFERYDGDRRVFFGHTVLDAPLDRSNAVGLDTGCVYGGMLTAYDCAEDEFTTVEPEKKYRERSDRHILSTGKY